MFKYKLITPILLLFISCNTPNKEVLHEEDDCDIGTHRSVLSRTDSILVLAEKEFKVIKQKQIDQNMFVDSLKYEIYTEQNTISDIQTELKKRVNVVVRLQLTKQELEESYINCEKKEKRIIDLEDSISLKREEFIDEKNYLINFYDTKIDSLVKKIGLLERDSSIVDFLEKKTNKKIKNKKNEKGN